MPDAWLDFHSKKRKFDPYSFCINDLGFWTPISKRLRSGPRRRRRLTFPPPPGKMKNMLSEEPQQPSTGVGGTFVPVAASHLVTVL
jgi:hypothetical protein